MILTHVFILMASAALFRSVSLKRSASLVPKQQIRFCYKRPTSPNYMHQGIDPSGYHPLSEPKSNDSRASVKIDSYRFPAYRMMECQIYSPSSVWLNKGELEKQDKFDFYIDEKWPGPELSGGSIAYSTHQFSCYVTLTSSPDYKWHLEDSKRSYIIDSQDLGREQFLLEGSRLTLFPSWIKVDDLKKFIRSQYEKTSDTFESISIPNDSNLPPKFFIATFKNR